jgi:putative membrane protein
MSVPDLDPRIFFAAERTLLAWIRTGITIMALGFVISRFGLFVQLLALQASKAKLNTNETLSALLGIVFILAGALAILFASIQHKSFIATLPITDLPKGYSKTFSITLSIIIGILGLLLAAYLWIAGA